MSKVLLINGSPNEHGCTYTALRAVADELELGGVEAELLYLGKGAVADCVDCGYCRTAGEGRRCALGGAVNDILERLDEFDGIIAGSPVYYAGASGRLCSFMDRLFFAGGARMQGKLAASVVSCRRGGASAAFERLNKYYEMNNMLIVGSQYWNQVHGNTPEEAMQDAEGLQTMRTLGKNFVWLLKSIEAGRACGVPAPDYEAKVHTNFIR